MSHEPTALDGSPARPGNATLEVLFGFSPATIPPSFGGGGILGVFLGTQDGVEHRLGELALVLEDELCEVECVVDDLPDALDIAGHELGEVSIHLLPELAMVRSPFQTTSRISARTAAGVLGSVMCVSFV